MVERACLVLHPRPVPSVRKVALKRGPLGDVERGEDVARTDLRPLEVRLDVLARRSADAELRALSHETVGVLVEVFARLVLLAEAVQRDGRLRVADVEPDERVGVLRLRAVDVWASLDSDLVPHRDEVSRDVAVDALHLGGNLLVLRVPFAAGALRSHLVVVLALKRHERRVRAVGREAHEPVAVLEYSVEPAALLVADVLHGASLRRARLKLLVVDSRRVVPLADGQHVHGARALRDCLAALHDYAFGVYLADAVVVRAVSLRLFDCARRAVRYVGVDRVLRVHGKHLDASEELRRRNLVELVGARVEEHHVVRILSAEVDANLPRREPVHRLADRGASVLVVHRVGRRHHLSRGVAVAADDCAHRGDAVGDGGHEAHLARDVRREQHELRRHHLVVAVRTPESLYELVGLPSELDRNLHALALVLETPVRMVGRARSARAREDEREVLPAVERIRLGGLVGAA